MSCGSCGASMRPDASFCGQCFGTLTTSGAVTAVGVGTRFVPETSQPQVRTYSRWRKTDSTFGPLGRVLWTLAMVLVLAVCLFSMDPFAVVAALIVIPVVLRSVWANGRLT